MNTLTRNGTAALVPEEFEETLAPVFDEVEPDLGSDTFDAPTVPSAESFDEEEEFAPSLQLSQLTNYDPQAELDVPTVVETEDEELNQPQAVGIGSLSATTDVDDDLDADESVVDPRTVKTRHGLIGSPFTKLLVVGAGTLVVILFLGLFLSSVMGGHGSKSPVVESSPSPSPSASPVDTTQDEVAKYKTDSALTRQKELLSGASKPQPLPTATPSPQTSPTPMPLAAPVAMPVAPAASVALSPVPLPTPSPIDPVEKWRMAATMGSYGQIPSGGNAGGSSSYAASVPTPAVPMPAPVFVPPVAQTTPGGSRPLSQLRSGSSTPGLRDHPLSAVLVGTTATAQTTTGIVLATDNTTPVAPDSPTAIKYLARLQNPLVDANGEAALPAGATLVIVARSFSPQTGMAEFVVSSVLVDNKEYAVPKDTLVVRGGDGGLVAFSKRGGASGGFFQAVLPAFFAGVSQASQIINQPSSSATVSGGSVSATTTSSNPNALAGFAQGFGMNLSQSIQQKAQAANQAAASAPASWQLGAGTSVKVFVNASFEM